MTDTALLPPDPSKPGRYWLKQHWGDNVVARWNPSGRYWNTGEFSVLTAKDAAVLGYTLASAHPIPSAAALERLHKLLSEIEDHAVAAAKTPVSPHTYILNSMKADGLRTAAAMLRAALEDK